MQYGVLDLPPKLLLSWIFLLTLICTSVDWDIHVLDLELCLTLPSLDLPGGSAINNLPAMQELQEMQVRSLGLEDPLEEGMATHSSILAWRIAWTEKSGGLQFIGSQSGTRLKWLCMHALPSHTACFHSVFPVSLHEHFSHWSPVTLPPSTITLIQPFSAFIVSFPPVFYLFNPSSTLPAGCSHTQDLTMLPPDANPFQWLTITYSVNSKLLNLVCKALHVLLLPVWGLCCSNLELPIGSLSYIMLFFSFTTLLMPFPQPKCHFPIFHEWKRLCIP